MKHQDAFIRNIRQIVNKQYTNPRFNVGSLILATGLSETQFRRKFDALADIPPNQFIQSFRLKKALKLLQKTELNISDIAFRTGFADPSYFSRIFLKNYAVTPREFRKNLP